jgi:flagellar biosynthesis protein FliQ
VNQDTVIELVIEAITVALEVSAPILLVGLFVGIVISIIQAVTQVQEMTLTFIPKIAAMAVVLVVLGPWMLNKMVSWVSELYLGIPTIIGT